MIALMSKPQARSRRLLLHYPTDGQFRPDDIALAAWAFVGHEADFPIYSRLDSVPGIESVEEQRIESERWEPVFWSMLEDEAHFLHQHHQGRRSLDYWRYLAAPHVMMLSSMVRARWICVERALHRFAEDSLTTDLLTGPWRGPITGPGELMSLFMWSEEFGHWLSSRILRLLAPANVTVSAERPAEPCTPPTREALDSAAGGSLARQLYDRFVLPVANITGPSRLERLAIAAWMWLKPNPRTSRRLPPPQAGQLPPAPPYPAALTTLLSELMTELRPSFVLEPLPAQGPRRKGKLRLSYADYSDHAARRKHAEWREAGGRIAFAQHGSDYGLSVPLARTPQMEYREDAFLTWGWTRHGDYQGRFLPMPMPKLRALHDRHHGGDDRIVMVSTTINPGMECFLGWPGSVLGYVSGKTEILRGLLANGKKVRYRPFLYEKHTMAIEQHILTANPQAEILQGSMWEGIQSSRLLVLDHYSTPFHEALVSNTPTVLFWSPLSPGVSPDNRHFFQRFRELGVIHDTPDSLVRQVEEIWPDVEGWWRRPELQALRQEFIRQHARTSRWWLVHWLGKLWNL